ncbi:hypothetical protein PAYE108092_15355 [Paracoccus yeei]
MTSAPPVPWSVPPVPFSRTVRPNSVIASTVVRDQFGPSPSRSARIAAASRSSERPMIWGWRTWLSQPAIEKAAMRASPFSRVAAKAPSAVASAVGPWLRAIWSVSALTRIASRAASRNSGSS